MKNSQIRTDQIILMNSEQLQELVREIHEIKSILHQKSIEGDFPELLRTSDVRKLLKVGESSLAGLRSNGTIPFTKIGGSIYYLKNDLLKIIKENYSGIL